MGVLDGFAHRGKGRTGKDGQQRLAQLVFPRSAQRIILQAVKQRGRRRAIGKRRARRDAQFDEPGFGLGQRHVQIVQQPLPARAHLLDLRAGAGAVFVQRIGVIQTFRRRRRIHQAQQRIAQFQLVLRGKFNVDALNAVAIIAHARQGNNHVFVNLEGVGVARDGGGARSVEPETLALLGAGGHKTFRAARLAHAHHFGGGARHGLFVMADQIANQHHFRPVGAVGLGRVADGFYIAFIQMFQTGQPHAHLPPRAFGLEVIGDFHNRGHGFAHLAEKFQTHRARDRRHFVQQPARRHHDAVRAFFLHARQTGEEFVGDILAQPHAAEFFAGNFQYFLAQQLVALFIHVAQRKARHGRIVNLAQIVFQPLNFQPLPGGRDHLPPHEVVQRRAPQHGLFAACVHGDVAAHARGFGGSRVDSKHPVCRRCRLTHARRHHARAGADSGGGFFAGGAGIRLDRAHVEQFFGVDDHRARIQRHGAAGVTCAAAARDDGQPQFDGGAHQRRDFLFRVGIEDDEGIFHAPVGGVRHMGDARVGVEGDVVAARVPRKGVQRALAQARRFAEKVFKTLHRRLRRFQQLCDARAAFRLCLQKTHTARIDGTQAVMQRLDERGAAASVAQQVVLQVRVALHHPDVAQHLEKHLRRAPGDALRAQLVQQIPGGRTEQADDDFAVGKRGVVVGNLAQAFSHGGRKRWGKIARRAHQQRRSGGQSERKKPVADGCGPDWGKSGHRKVISSYRPLHY